LSSFIAANVFVCHMWQQVNNAQCTHAYVHYNGWHVTFQKCPFEWGGSGPNLMHGSLDTQESGPKRHHVNRFCTAHPCDQHTHRHTYIQTHRPG